MRAKPFSRPTLIAAVELLEGHRQARFTRMVLRPGLEHEIGSGTAVSIAKKCDILGSIVAQRSGQVFGGPATLGQDGHVDAKFEQGQIWFSTKVSDAVGNRSVQRAIFTAAGPVEREELGSMPPRSATAGASFRPG
jgi:hypothetical protein